MQTADLESDDGSEDDVEDRFVVDSPQPHEGADETFVPAINPEFCVFMSIAKIINAAIRQHKLARIHMDTIHAPKSIKRQLPGCEASGQDHSSKQKLAGEERRSCWGLTCLSSLWGYFTEAARLRQSFA